MWIDWQAIPITHTEQFAVALAVYLIYPHLTSQEARTSEIGPRGARFSGGGGIGETGGVVVVPNWAAAAEIRYGTGRRGEFPGTEGEGTDRWRSGVVEAEARKE